MGVINDGISLKTLFETFKSKGVGYDKVKAKNLIKKFSVESDNKKEN